MQRYIRLSLVPIIVSALLLSGCNQLLDFWEATGAGSPPDEVTNLSASATDSQVTLTWSDPGDSDFDHVNVSWTPGGAVVREVGPGTQSYTAVELTNGTEYIFTVRTVDAAGNVSDGKAITATPQKSTAGEVTDLSASASDGEVILSWSDPSNSGLDQIEITWDPADGESQPTLVSPGTENSTVTGLTNGTSYTFTVKTVHTSGNTSTGTSISATPIAPGTERWTYTTGNSVASSPAVSADGTVYVGSQDGRLYAINADGTLKWRYETGAEIYSSPAIATDGTIYVTSWDDHLYALNPDGTLKWSYVVGDTTVGSGGYSSPAIASDGTVYVGSFDDHLYALNPDGTLRWRYATGDDIDSSPAVASDGTVYVGSADDKLYALSPDATLRWSYTTGGNVDSDPAIAADGTVYVASNDGNLYALNPDGTLKWSNTTGGGSGPVVGADGTVYVGSDGKLYALNPDGSIKWHYDTSDVIHSSPAVASDGTVYLDSFYNGQFYAISPDGALEWRYTTGDYMNSNPAVTADGTVYVGSWDNKLYAINGESGGLADSPWPMFGHDLRHTGRAES